jgi:hypothetical protein
MMDLGIARKVVGSSTLRKESEGNPSRTAAFKNPEQNAQMESLDRQRNPCRLHSGSRPGDNSVPAHDDSGCRNANDFQAAIAPIDDCSSRLGRA